MALPPIPGCAGELDQSAWYAEPLSAEQAGDLQRQLEQAGGKPVDTFTTHLYDMICHYWQGKDISLDADSLLHSHRDPLYQGLVRLIHGQLLASRKLRGAMTELSEGLILLSPTLSAADYMTVMKRHEILKSLVFTDRPAPAQGLAQLLNEAGVVQAMVGRGRLPSHPDRKDTLG